MYRVEFISREVRCELWTFYSHFQWGLERAAVLCPWRCLHTFKGRTFSLLVWVLPDRLLRAGGGVREATQLRIYHSFLLQTPPPPTLWPTPLSHTSLPGDSWKIILSSLCFSPSSVKSVDSVLMTQRLWAQAQEVVGREMMGGSSPRACLCSLSWAPQSLPPA